MSFESAIKVGSIEGSKSFISESSFLWISSNEASELSELLRYSKCDKCTLP